MKMRTIPDIRECYEIFESRKCQLGRFYPLNDFLEITGIDVNIYQEIIGLENHLNDSGENEIKFVYNGVWYKFVYKESKIKFELDRFIR